MKSSSTTTDTSCSCSLTRDDDWAARSSLHSDPSFRTGADDAAAVADVDDSRKKIDSFERRSAISSDRMRRCVDISD